jgi:hypothetical protein
MTFFIDNLYIYMIISNSLYYINYICFYTILIILFKKKVIIIFKDAYNKYILTKENHYIILQEENKHLVCLKKTYKEKRNTILFFKNAIESFIIIKNNEQIETLKHKKILEIQIDIDQQNIKKTLYNNHLLEYSKKSFKNIFFDRFKNHTDASFARLFIKSENKQ